MVVLAVAAPGRAAVITVAESTLKAARSVPARERYPSTLIGSFVPIVAFPHSPTTDPSLSRLCYANGIRTTSSERWRPGRRLRVTVTT
ncbi:MAG TPA: hypothetical protein VEJ84_05625 [Acidimicrobiales bacterium]|nr:hypothetical protein [Acidimicrobiales bacterium]